MPERIQHIVVATDPMYLVSVGHGDVLHPLCLVWFGKKDGTIYVQPRFPDVSGLMSVVYPDGQALINLRAAGFTASCLPKLSHHPSGRVHFSRTDQLDSSVGMASFELPTGTGKVFDLKIWNGDRLPVKTKRRSQRGHVDFRFSKRLPGGVVLSGIWSPVADLLNQIPAATPMVEPMVRLPRYNNAAMFLTRPPRGYPHRNHLLVLSLIEGASGSGDELSMFFAGGFDPRVNDSSPFIAALFPWDQSQEDAYRLPSVDKKSSASDTRNNSECGGAKAS